MNNERYLIFAPWVGGLSNVIMSLELILSIASITNRRIALPERVWIDHLQAPYLCSKDLWFDLWEIFDKDVFNQEFKTVPLESLEEFQLQRHLIQTDASYTTHFGKQVKDVYIFNHHNPDYVDQTCFTHHLEQYYKSEDFQKFAAGRPVIDLQRPEKYLQFEANLFGPFYYQIYPGAARQRNALKQKINRALAYQPRFQELAKNVSLRLGAFNAVHIRRTDFLKWIPQHLEDVAKSDQLLIVIDQLFQSNLPLYIATDEKDRSFFSSLKTRFNIYFFDDFDWQLSALEKAVVEQCICAEAETFYGTWKSTFSKRINIMRGLARKPAYDYMGLNHVVANGEEFASPYPWLSLGEWGWAKSSYLQWHQEPDA